MTDKRSSVSSGGSSGAGQANLIAPVYFWIAGLQGWRALAFCAALGAFANLAFPPLHFWPAFAISLTGLVWSLDGATLAARPKRAAFWRVAAFGFAYYLVGMHWIAFAFLVNPGAHLMFIWLPLIALPAILTAVLSACVYIGFRYWQPGPARLIIFAVSFMFGEWVRGALFGIGGLPWNLPGMIWAPGEAISQSASIWGIYGLSALTVIAMASPATLADRRARGSTASRAAPVIVAAIVFGAIWGWGARRLADAAPTDDPGTGVIVRLVDIGTPQAEKHDPANAEKIVRRYLELSGPATANTPDIVIWPEGALPYFLFEWDGALRAVSDSIGQRKLIMGVPRLEAVSTGPDTIERRAYNSLAVLSGDADVRGARHWYDKHMLVPIGEFMPFAGLLKSIGLSTLQDLAPGGFEAGPMPSSVRVDGVPPFGPLICYEGIFPGLSPTGDDRPDWLVNISIDAWFGEFLGPAQHAAQARYRAIEEGLPMARVASRGETGMIDGYGRWTERGEPADPARFTPDPDGWRSSVVDASIPKALEPTPYGAWRDGLFWVMLLGFNLGLFVLPRR